MKLNHAAIQYEHEENGPFNICILYAVQRRLIEMPIGFIWYKPVLRDLIFISYIHVHEEMRRQRIATAMLQELARCWPHFTICTETANDLSRPWLKARGFVNESSGWFLRPTPPEVCPMI